MKLRFVLPAMIVGLFAVSFISNAQAFELFNRKFNNGGGCCAEASCAAAEPSCGCAAAPSCAAPVEASCNAAPACCEAAPSCCDSGCGQKRCHKHHCHHLRNRCHQWLHHRKSCCQPTCCEAAPSCGCEAAQPSCGCGS